MWAFLLRLLNRLTERVISAPTSSNPVDRLSAVGSAQARSYAPLRPWHVRGRRFTMRWRGLDPAEVDTFLNRVANDLAAVYAELARSREETARIKDALRQWQSAQAPTAYELARR